MDGSSRTGRGGAPLTCGRRIVARNGIVRDVHESNWRFLTMLRDRGRLAAGQWLAAHYDDVGENSTVNLKNEFLQTGLPP